MKMNRRIIGVYLLVVIILSGIIDIIWIQSPEVATQGGISYLLMFMPAISVLIIKLLYFRGTSISGIKRCRLIYIFEAVMYPFVYVVGSYCIYWIFRPESFTGELVGLGDAPIVTSLIMILIVIITAFGEEVGWRGFLLPGLVDIYGEKKAIFLNGIIWALWHWPLILAGLYMSGVPMWYQLPIITINFLLMTVIMSLLRFHSNSVWPAVILHAFHNYFDQVICMNLTEGDKSLFFVGETGVITTLLLLILVIMLVKRKGKISFAENKEQAK